MMRFLYCLFSALFVMFASCEDTQTSKNNNTSPSTKISQEQNIKENLDKIKDDNKDETELDTLDPANVARIEDKVRNANPLIVQEELIPFLTEYGKNNPETRVLIETRLGNFEVQLYRDTPLHRANFIWLTKMGYFDQTFFHRVAIDFVVQGGNSDYVSTSIKRNNIGSFLIPSEFEAGHPHTRGAFSAAKYAEQNVSKASSPFEFFVVQSNRGAHHLDNDHTVFGRVVKGMDVIDKIAQEDVSEGEWPLTNVTMKVSILD